MTSFWTHIICFVAGLIVAIIVASFAPPGDES